jgi:NDP-sugar pyrophosphorylase family protein
MLRCPTWSSIPRERERSEFIAVHPPFNFHLAEFYDPGLVHGLRSSRESQVWINGGYFAFRNRILDYLRDGEGLFLEPFNRLIAVGSAKSLTLIVKEDTDKRRTSAQRAETSP